MKKLLLLLVGGLLLCSQQVMAQQYVFGKVQSEDSRPISGVTVINVGRQHRTETGIEGTFMVQAQKGDLLRIVKAGYQRVDIKMEDQHLSTNIAVELIKLPHEIEEVTIENRVTGDLATDAKKMGDTPRMQELKSEITSYIARPSSSEVLAAKKGEFVQFNPGGISIGKIKNKWDDVDLMAFLTKEIEPKFFEDLGIHRTRISDVVFYMIQQNFERKTILKYGYCSYGDIERFKRHVQNSIVAYFQKFPSLQTKSK